MDGSDDADDLGPLSEAERAAYLDRIGLDGDAASGAADLTTLADLQLAHLGTVPFENLDIHTGRAIVLDDDHIFTKVVDGRRGGYCYELNSLLARLLRSFGFEVALVSARIPGEDGELSPEFDHLTLLVTPRTADDGGATTHLVDVGFGDAFTRPIPLLDGEPVDDRDRRVRLVEGPEGWGYEEDKGAGWRLSYRFTMAPRRLAEFRDRNRWQQTDPDSHFRRSTVCTLLTTTGRVTVAGSRLITSAIEGERRERTLTADDVAPVLLDRFGVDLGEAELVSRS